MWLSGFASLNKRWNSFPLTNRSIYSPPLKPSLRDKMYIIECEVNLMTTSDWIEIFGILASLITSIIAIIISVKTLQQNNKMIEESTRPYIVVCGKVINCQDPTFYLVIKNYGRR